MEQEIVIVSGLPRSGTSLMMQMLHHGGLEVVADHIRAADTDNPRGYYELEQVKQIKTDASWLPATRGKAFKMVSQLLYELPTNERYRVVFMERDLDEMLDSQEKMLERLGRSSGPREEIKNGFISHLQRIREWLAQQPHIAVLYVSYNDLMARPREESERVARFLGGRTDPARMAEAVDASLYRNRKSSSSAS